MSHSPEPWTAEPYSGPAPDFIMFSATSHGSGGKTFVVATGGQQIGQARENLERIVACVNACAGIPTEHLTAERYSNPLVLDTLRMLSRFFASGGLESVPDGCHVRCALKFEMTTLDHYGQRLIPDHSWNTDQAKYILEKFGYTVTAPKDSK